MPRKQIKNPHLGLPKNLFNRIVKLVPFVACELVILNKQREVLLTWRDDQYWRGWHCPGGLLRYKEPFEERIQAVARNELGIHISSWKFIEVFNYLDDPRGHTIALVFLCKTPDTPKTGKYFKKIPHHILKHHRQYLENILK